jgi:hypothetical protein
MATVFTVCTTEKQRSLLLSLFSKDSMQKIFIKKCFFVYGGNCLLRKAVPPWGKRFSNDEDVEPEVRKWLRQKSEDFYAAGFDALVKRWDKCINVYGGYIEK